MSIIKVMVLNVLFLLALTASANVKPTLFIELSKTSSEYGRPIYMKIFARNFTVDDPQTNSESSSQRFPENTILNIAKHYTKNISNNFSVENLDIETEDSRQIIRIKMYPRRTGVLPIPTFSIGKIDSQQTTILIQQAKAKKGNILLSSKHTSLKVWQRQQVLISITLTTPEEFAHVELKNQRIDGIEITTLPITRVWSNEGSNGVSNGVSTITASWSILPLQSGHYEVDLPAIEYHLNGVVRRTFFLPQLKFNVRPLPVYLPPTIPVGEIQLRSSISSDNWIISKLLSNRNLAYWNISISSKTLTPYWLPPILRQVKNNESLQLFPAKSERSLQANEKQVNGKVTHSIPFKALSQGKIKLPEIKIQYFDPNSGKLVNQTIVPPEVYSISPVSFYLFALVLILSLVYVTRMMFYFFKQWISHRLAYRSALHSLHQANSTDKIIEALKVISSIEGWPQNISISRWLLYWKSKYTRIDKLEILFNTINRKRYCIESNRPYNKSNTSISTKDLASEVSYLLASTQHWYQRGENRTHHDKLKPLTISP